ncbi:DEAD/DEAH box helicase [Persicobacter diffluens]|uniref:ATP-dependent helicase n=1 Tax=Persicobacter diffluens TaxID=981 RepID=A0AAN4W1V2_9BACT|nr:hypothetical protein PEDI_37330 [Persicobacter diffluens]
MDYTKNQWGDAWIADLEAIDHQERLAKGADWAGKGAVKQWLIRGHTLWAQVGGQFNHFYRVGFQYPEMSADQKKKIWAYLLEDTYRMVHLFYGVVPEGFGQFLNEQIVFFKPQHWTEMRMQCQCTADAQPCVHTAAALYHFAQQVNKDPLLLYKLQTFDLKTNVARYFQKEGQTLEHSSFQWSSVVDVDFIPENQQIQMVDFGTLPKFTEQRLSFIEENPPLYHKCCKQLLLNAFKKLKKLPDFLPEVEEDFQQSLLAHLKLSDDFFLLFNESGCLLKILHTHAEGFVELIPAGQFNLFCEVIRAIPLSEINWYGPKVQLLRQTLLLCHLAIERQMLQPFVVQSGQKMIVSWTIAHFDANIRQMLEALSRQLSDHLCFLQTNVGVKPITAVPQLLLFAGGLIQPMLSECLLPLHAASAENSIPAILFGDGYLDLAKEEESAQAIALENWLRAFSLEKAEERILLQIDEAENEGQFVLRLLADQTENVQGEELSFRAFLKSAPLKVQMRLFNRIQPLWNRLPVLKQLMEADYQAVTFNQQELANLLIYLLPQLEAMGLQIRLTKALRNLVQPKLTISISSEEQERNKGQLDLKSLFKYDWKVALGDDVLSAEEFEALLDDIEGVVKLKGQYVHLVATDVAKLMAQLQKGGPKIQFAGLLEAALEEHYQGQTIELDQKVRQHLSQIKEVRQVLPPNSLQAQLRPYQQIGYEWLLKNAYLGLGAIMADDMGLGKTLQTLAFLLKLKEEKRLSHNKPALIVVPTSLLTNWQSEIKKFTPLLTTKVYHGQQTELNREFDLLLTTYGKFRMAHERLSEIPFSLMVIDEAQNIKNAQTRQSQLIRAFKVPIKIALSGTPVENRLMEYWSLMDFVNPSLLGTATYFKKHFVKPIEEEQDLERLQIFHNICRPFLMRRLKSDKSIISDLPEKIENNHFCAISPMQASLYQATMEQYMMKMDAAEAKDRSALILQLITALKQICNHPYQHLSHGEQSPEHSGKATALMELMSKVGEAGEKMLIFTQYRQMGNLICDWIRTYFNKEPLFLHGACSRDQRDEMVQKFKKSAAHPFFVLSLKAAGTGLNLVEANHVVHYDLWWNPAVESQATDRAYRIGQQNNVMVHRLISKGTFESQINDLIQKKKVLAEEVVESGGQFLGDMSDRELADFFKLKNAEQ